MIDPTNSPTGQDLPSGVQPLTDVFISPAARRYMGYRMEANAGSPPAAANGGQGQGDGGGQAQPDAGDGGGFNWDLFPDVPEAQRPLLEPHLKTTQGHVTKLEQQYAPYKPLIDAGATPETLQNLVQFDQAFTKDPLGTWLMLAENMQKEGTLSDELDLAVVKAILNGEDPPGEEGAGAADAGAAADGEQIPQWAQEIKEELASRRESEQTQQQQQAADQRAQQLQTALEGMRSQLKEAGYPEDQLSDELLTGAIIAHRGDADKALSELTGLREGVLAGFTKGKTGSEQEEREGPEMPNGAPKVPKGKGRGPGREYAEARTGAQQFLESKQRAEAQ